jgi:hypothetical protein
MVTYKGTSRFFARASNGKEQLDVEQIRAAFLLSDKIAERVRDFRLDRIAKIRADDTPVPLAQGAKIVLHVVPLGAFSSLAQIVVQSVSTVSRELELTPLGPARGWYERFNLEGYVRYAGPREGGPASAYLQIFRNGALETVCTPLAPYSAGGRVQGPILEKHVIGTLRCYVCFLNRLRVDVPFAVMMSLLGFKGYRIGPQEMAPMRDIGYFDRDVILVPEVLLESFDADITKLMKQTFDVVWNAAGWARSLE